MSSRYYELPELLVLNIVLGYIDGLDGWGSIPSRGMRFFCILQGPDWLWGPPSLLSNGHWGQPGHEDDHSPLYTAEVMNGGAIPPLPHISSWFGA
jgi:hypothetical protein